MALLLLREVDESVQIGDDIVVTVYAVKGKKVRLNIEAPAGVRILRTELEEGRSARTLDRTAPDRVRRSMRDLPRDGDELGKALGRVVDVTG